MNPEFLDTTTLEVYRFILKHKFTVRKVQKYMEESYYIKLERPSEEWCDRVLVLWPVKKGH